jgi:mono/diheme cytochrome c family protein
MANAEFDCVPGKRRSPVIRRATRLGLPILLLGVAACRSLGMGEAPRPDASMGLLIAQDNCSGCHETSASGASPNPQAPPFIDIVNRPGMTRETLAAWLRDGHNYPVEMGFHLEPHQIDSLVAYMIRWRSNPPTT